MHQFYDAMFLFQLGAVMSQATHDPKKLKKLDPTRGRPVEIASGPLKIPGRM